MEIFRLIAYLVIICMLLIYIRFEINNRRLIKSVTQLSRGTKTERNLVLKLIKHGIPSNAIYHDLYLKNPYNNYCQIDLVVPTKVGIIVFEVKKYSGWILGNSYQHHWTQVLAYGRKKYYFYNPIKQNHKHVLDLQKKLPNEKIPYFSVIVFYGDCILRNIDVIDENTFVVKQTKVLEVIEMILENFNSADYSNKHEIIKVLGEAAENGKDANVRKKHVQNIRNMLQE